ncbi:hypothetical protein V6C03_08320 [Methyloligella sp. 2.7D]|uniref:F0F1 ATP synthase subunit B family protein n=1 Tax=unclassified Methyloligella TaxID=2625955 RepID=UPI00157D6FC9|nr:hypothetical protein [Methyloligella sp. GL2]QKP78125.1 hypothetical protein HT051_12130 [Methyloligella sp. GL2]
MTIDWWTLLLQTVNFLLLVWLLQHFLYKPVRAVIEKRRALAERALTQAEATEKQATAAKADFEAKTAGLDEARKAELKQAHETAEAEAKKILADARQQADAIRAEAKRDAKESQAEAVAGVREDIVQTAVKMAGTILAKTGDGALNEVFLARLLDQIGNLSKEDRARIDGDIASGGAPEIATAAKLSRAEQGAWTKSLRAALKFTGAPRYSVDAALLGGAELRFPHATIRFAWSDQLKKAGEILQNSRGGAA